jgi:hypothetical protein
LGRHVAFVVARRVTLRPDARQGSICGRDPRDQSWRVRYNYATFEDYCEQRWELTIRHVQYLTGAATFASLLKANYSSLQVPSRETHIRPPIHDDQSWRKRHNHATFEEYCDQRWELAKQTVDGRRRIRGESPPWRTSSSFPREPHPSAADAS